MRNLHILFTLINTMIKPFIPVIAFFLCIAALIGWESFQEKSLRNADPVKYRDLQHIHSSDTLHVVMGYNSVSYFVYKGTPMGYQFEMVQQLCHDFAWFLDLSVSNDVEKAFQKTAFGECDLIAMELTIDSNRYPRIAFTEPLYEMRSILVQRSDNSSHAVLNDLKELDGKTVVIPRKTIYQRQLEKLEDSLKIDINIHSVEKAGTEDLTAAVASGNILYTICDEHLARTVKAYFPQLDFSLAISPPKPVAWAVNEKAIRFRNALNEWIVKFKQNGNLAFLQRKYFDHPILYLLSEPVELSLSKGRLSAYDDSIKKYSRIIDWDWRLISSLIYQESRFTPGFTSPGGAFGIMQLMPVTAAQFGVFPGSKVHEQIRGGLQLIHYMDSAFAPFVLDKNEREKVVIAAYNLGMPHFFDAFALAKKMNKLPLTYPVVLECLRCKTKSQFYNDPIVRYGYINPWYADRFVKEIYARYNAYCAIFPAE